MSEEMRTVTAEYLHRIRRKIYDMIHTKVPYNVDPLVMANETINIMRCKLRDLADELEKPFDGRTLHE